MPRSFSSGALSIWSNGVNGLRSGYFSCSTRVIAAVSVVLPWSICPMVPMLTCGLVRWNLAFATGFSSLVLRPAHAGGRVRTDCWLLASRLGDDLLGDAGRDLGVRIELHGVVRPALGPAAQIPDVAEHLRQRYTCLDHPAPGPLLHGLDLATAAVQVADDVAHVVVRSPDLDGHHRFEQRGIRLGGRLLERHRTGDLEGELGRVDLVVGTVGQRHLDVDHRVAGQHAELGGLLAAGVYRGDVLPGDPASGYLVLELVPAAVAAGGLEVDEHASVLAGAAGLLLVGVLDLLDLAGDRLAGLLVGPDLEGRLLLGEPLDRDAQPRLVTLGPRLDGHVDHRRRERHR